MTSCRRTGRSRARRRCAVALAVGGGAAAVLALGLPGAAGAAGADDGSTPGDGLVLMPASGGGGITVGIRAECVPDDDGTVYSRAFTSPAKLRPTGDGDAVAVATVRDGLRPDRGFVVTANCSDTESLSASFVHTGGRPRGPVDAGVGAFAERAAGARHEARGTSAMRAAGEVRRAREAREGRERDGEAGGPGVGSVALAFGGGLATAALTGYVLTVRAGSSRQRALGRRR